MATTDIRKQALENLQKYQVVMLNGHFDFGNGYHGQVYLHPHQLFSHPSRIWRLAQDLISVLPPSVLSRTEVVAGPATGGALKDHAGTRRADRGRDGARGATKGWVRGRSRGR